MRTLSTGSIQSWLSWFARGILLLGILFLIGRLVELQVIKGAYYKGLADGNRIRRVSISAPRGKIIARGGETLVSNKDVQKAVIFDSVNGYEKKDIYDPKGGFEIITESVRYYPLGAQFAHVSGYVGFVSQDEVGKVNPDCMQVKPKSGDSYIGRSGLEEEYDCELSGIDGEKLIEVDTTGKSVRTLATKNAVSGSDLHTTIDYPLQRKVSELMAGKAGAVIVTDAKGEVLALYSSPSFDPNVFLDENEESSVTSILDGADLPLFNRVIGGLYHPGSTFKPIVAVSGLENGIINENYTYEDTGSIVVNDYSYSNWYFTQYGGREGQINLVRAIARSTDTFFYKLGELIGPEELAEWARKFGLGEQTGVDLPGEVTGLIPDPAWKLRVKSEPWYLGNTYHMSIGQGDLALTPIALNSAITAVINGGKLCTPTLTGDEDCQDMGLNQTGLELIKKGMISACSTGGTGYTFFDSNPVVGCKTGTAETIKEGVTHAWFTFFAPGGKIEDGNITVSNEAEIVATVLVEEGGEGSKVAGPIARDIFNYVYSGGNNIKRD